MTITRLKNKNNASSSKQNGYARGNRNPPVGTRPAAATYIRLAYLHVCLSSKMEYAPRSSLHVPRATNKTPNEILVGVRDVLTPKNIVENFRQNIIDEWSMPFNIFIRI